jgi:hypothetical protein
MHFDLSPISWNHRVGERFETVQIIEYDDAQCMNMSCRNRKVIPRELNFCEQKDRTVLIIVIVGINSFTSGMHL